MSRGARFNCLSGCVIPVRSFHGARVKFRVVECAFYTSARVDASHRLGHIDPGDVTRGSAHCICRSKAVYEPC